jgi:hypothetical protein
MKNTIKYVIFALILLIISLGIIEYFVLSSQVDAPKKIIIQKAKNK